MEEEKTDNNIYEKYFKSINKSPSKQICVGAASGWCMGFLSVKVGKLTAVCVGTSIILFHFAQHNNYITINWKKVNNDLEKITDRAEEKIVKESSMWMKNISKFAKENSFLFVGFVGGFFVGTACG